MVGPQSPLLSIGKLKTLRSTHHKGNCNLHIGIDSICILRAATEGAFSTPASAPSLRLYDSNDMAPTASMDVLIGRASARLAVFSKLIEDPVTSYVGRMAAFDGGVGVWRWCAVDEETRSQQCKVDVTSAAKRDSAFSPCEEMMEKRHGC